MGDGLLADVGFVVAKPHGRGQLLRDRILELAEGGELIDGDGTGRGVDVVARQTGGDAVSMEVTAREAALRNGDQRRVLRLGFLLSVKHARDRKSTRLNSSHLVISYAVFR